MDSLDTDEVKNVETESISALNNATLMSEDADERNGQPQIRKLRTPRRILHFSDGVLEEYSTDEEEVDGETVKKTAVSELNAVNSKSLTWGPWFMYKAVVVSSKTLSACDYAGEKLAKFFGITSPKYAYEIDVYETMKCEDEERRKQEDVEMGGWTQSGDNTRSRTSKQPE